MDARLGRLIYDLLMEKQRHRGGIDPETRDPLLGAPQEHMGTSRSSNWPPGCSYRALVLSLALGMAMFSLQGARASDKIPEIENFWSTADLHKASGDLLNLKQTLDNIEAELQRRQSMGFLAASDAYVSATRARVTHLRAWLTPQLPAYQKLVNESTRLAHESWNLGLFQGGMKRAKSYATLRRDLASADTLGAAFVKAFPDAIESPILKKLAAAKKNLDEEKKRAVVSWLHQAEEQFEIAQSRQALAPATVALLLLQVQAIDPAQPKLAALVGKLQTYHKERFEQATSQGQRLRSMPPGDLAKYASLKARLGQVFLGHYPSTRIVALTIPEEPGLRVDVATGAEIQTLPVFLLAQIGPSACELWRVWFSTHRNAGGKAYSPFALTGLEKLNPMNCPAR